MNNESVLIPTHIIEHIILNAENALLGHFDKAIALGAISVLWTSQPYTKESEQAAYINELYFKLLKLN
jgi:hypothetical protein